MTSLRVAPRLLLIEIKPLIGQMERTSPQDISSKQGIALPEESTLENEHGDGDKGISNEVIRQIIVNNPAGLLPIRESDK
ncbi:MAG: hypothetical protein OXC98_12415 [bacterium]|nr:hypothetical protein [Acidimicrobiia bacterium]MCY4651150.1 hypothetical protein [bacterium]